MYETCSNLSRYHSSIKRRMKNVRSHTCVETFQSTQIGSTFQSALGWYFPPGTFSASILNFTERWTLTPCIFCRGICLGLPAFTLWRAVRAKLVIERYGGHTSRSWTRCHRASGTLFWLATTPGSTRQVQGRADHTRGRARL